jgi:hypothetical protein
VVRERAGQGWQVAGGLAHRCCEPDDGCLRLVCTYQPVRGLPLREPFMKSLNFFQFRWGCLPTSPPGRMPIRSGFLRVKAEFTHPWSGLHTGRPTRNIASPALINSDKSVLFPTNQQ